MRMRYLDYFLIFSERQCAYSLYYDTACIDMHNIIWMFIHQFSQCPKQPYKIDSRIFAHVIIYYI